jgi:hypothetical protein
MTPGRLVYLLYHYPWEEFCRSVHEGGPWRQWLDRRGRGQMEHAAGQLPSPPDFGSALEVHQLTGRAFAFQSLFCLWTFAHASRRTLAPVFYDDGTLTAAQKQSLRELFPRGRLVTHAESAARVETLLPAHHFPTLRERFFRYSLVRKLINLHLGATGWKLGLDSDLLFYRRPDFLLQWLADPQRPLHLLDIGNAYGYSPGLLEKLAGRPLPARVNAGLCGLRSESIDWEKLEWWCARLLRAEGGHYLLEQALTALLLAGQDFTVAPERDYIVLPSREEVASPRAVMHHYVHDSKRWYFREAWKRVIQIFDHPELVEGFRRLSPRQKSPKVKNNPKLCE